MTFKKDKGLTSYWRASNAFADELPIKRRKKRQCGAKIKKEKKM